MRTLIESISAACLRLYSSLLKEMFGAEPEMSGIECTVIPFVLSVCDTVRQYLLGALLMCTNSSVIETTTLCRRFQQDARLETNGTNYLQGGEMFYLRSSVGILPNVFSNSASDIRSSSTRRGIFGW